MHPNPFGRIQSQIRTSRLRRQTSKILRLLSNLKRIEPSCLCLMAINPDYAQNPALRLKACNRLIASFDINSRSSVKQVVVDFSQVERGRYKVPPFCQTGHGGQGCRMTLDFARLRSCARNSGGALTRARLTLFNWNMVVGDCGYGTGRGKRFVGNGRGRSSCVQNKGGFFNGPAKQRCDARQIKTTAKMNRCHSCHRMTSKIIPPLINGEISRLHSSSRSMSVNACAC